MVNSASVPSVNKPPRSIYEMLWDEEATTSEILHVQFGQYPPPGFPKNIRPDDTVVYIPRLDPNTAIGGVAGQISISIFSPLAYEGSYRPESRVLQISGRYRARPSDTADEVVFHEHGHGIAAYSPSKESQVMDDAHDFSIKNCSFRKKALGRIWQSWAAVPYGIANIPYIFKFVFSSSFDFSSRLDPSFFGKYSLADHEIETQIGVLIAESVRRKIWERVPLTKYEFWAACKDSGLRLHPSIRDELDKAIEQNPDIAKTFLKRNIFRRIGRNLTSSPVFFLNKAYLMKMTRVNQVLHWREDMPYLCGHYYELMRLPDGRKRMGFEESFNNIREEPRRRNPIAMIGRILGLAR